MHQSLTEPERQMTGTAQTGRAALSWWLRSCNVPDPRTGPAPIRTRHIRACHSPQHTEAAPPAFRPSEPFQCIPSGGAYAGFRPSYRKKAPIDHRRSAPSGTARPRDQWLRLLVQRAFNPLAGRTSVINPRFATGGFHAQALSRRNHPIPPETPRLLVQLRQMHRPEFSDPGQLPASHRAGKGWRAKPRTSRRARSRRPGPRGLAEIAARGLLTPNPAPAPKARPEKYPFHPSPPVLNLRNGAHTMAGAQRSSPSKKRR